ncbi:MAG: TetR/AcrR family transcriptional regulator [Janthinobacterium lividum]
MNNPSETAAPKPASSRLSKAARRRQLLAMALVIVREEGADRLTLGHLATRAGVSKPITYEHFSTRAGLLAALYKALDEQHTQALQAALRGGQRSLAETAQVLASASVHCSLDMGAEWQAVGAALSGSEEMAAVQRELLAGYAHLFVGVLEPHSALAPAALHRYCVGLVGAGEALSALLLAGDCSEQEAAATFAALIQGGMQALSS